MDLKVRLHRRARADLRSIRDYLIEHAGKRSADKMRSHLLQRIAQLSRLPLSGTATSEPGVRIFAPTRYPYRVYYVVKRSQIVILHIRHTSRQAPDDLPS